MPSTSDQTSVWPGAPSPPPDWQATSTWRSVVRQAIVISVFSGLWSSEVRRIVALHRNSGSNFDALQRALRPSASPGRLLLRTEFAGGPGWTKGSRSAWGYRRLPLHAVARVTRGVPAEEASATDAADGAAFRAWGTQNGRTSFNPEPHGRRRLCGRRVATIGALPRRDAPSRRRVRGASCRGRAERARVQGRAGARRPKARAAGQLPARPHPAARGRGDRPEEATLRDRRPAGGARPWDRWLQGRQRDWRRDEGGASGLFHRLPARPGAGPDHPRHRSRRGNLPRDGGRAPSRGRGQALRHRQLPGRLGGDARRGAPARALRADHRRRDAAVLLGGRARTVPDALLGRAAWRLVADRAGGRSRRRHLRRRGAGAELREPEPGQHPLDQAVQSLVEDRHRARALPRLREVVGRSRHAERRGDAVDRRRALRRQPPRRRRDPHARRHRDRPAQRPLADRRLLLARRQHHAAAAGARLDSRSLRRRGRDPRLRPDHRLHDPRQGRAPRDFRLGRRRAEGARRVRLEHRPDRRPAARALRGGADARRARRPTTPIS